MCELSFRLKDGSTANIEELRKFADAGGSVLDKVKEAKMKVVWPHERPKPTGEVRAKLIHQRMHRQQENRITNREMRENKGKYLQTLSTSFILIITVPAVAYALYAILKWAGFDLELAKQYSLIGALILFGAEIGLTIIHAYKSEKAEEYILRTFNNPINQNQIKNQTPKPKQE